MHVLTLPVIDKKAAIVVVLVDRISLGVHKVCKYGCSLGTKISGKYTVKKGGGAAARLEITAKGVHCGGSHCCAHIVCIIYAAVPYNTGQKLFYIRPLTLLRQNEGGGGGHRPL